MRKPWSLWVQQRQQQEQNHFWAAILVFFQQQQNYKFGNRRDENNLFFTSFSHRNANQVLYADLDNFSIPEIPTMTTSPYPQPPMKKPTPYLKTDYSEITHF